MAASDLQTLHRLRARRVSIGAYLERETIRHKRLVTTLAKAIATIALMGATLLPMLRMIEILATAGADTLSSDDFLFVTPLIDQVLSGTYHWQNFFHDTFYNHWC